MPLGDPPPPAAIVYPLSTDLFQDYLRFSSVSFDPQYGQETSGQANGAILVKDLRPFLWKAQVTTAPMDNPKTVNVQALLEVMDGSINTFYMYNPLQPVPQWGTTDDSVCVINSFGTNTLILGGLDPAFTLTRGDALAFDYLSGANTVRAYHRVMQSTGVKSDGTTYSFQVRPAIRQGTGITGITGAAVKLVNPQAEMRIIPGSAQVNPVNQLFNAIQFNAIQALR